MVEGGDTAPDFTAPLANGDVETFTLSDNLDEAPLVLAFFPGAFTSVCTNEMVAFRDQLSRFEEVGATVYGVSVDSPFALNEFRDKHDLPFGLISDFNRELVDAYGVRMAFDDSGLQGLAKRSVFVIDGDGVVTWSWVGEDAGLEPDYDAVRTAAAEAAE
ncbi:MAG: redoxin domain-containing protein [Halodesulfurarchaeum sp.]